MVGQRGQQLREGHAVVEARQVSRLGAFGCRLPVVGVRQTGPGSGATDAVITARHAMDSSQLRAEERPSKRCRLPRARRKVSWVRSSSPDASRSPQRINRSETAKRGISFSWAVCGTTSLTLRQAGRRPGKTCDSSTASGAGGTGSNPAGGTLHEVSKDPAIGAFADDRSSRPRVEPGNRLGGSRGGRGRDRLPGELRNGATTTPSVAYASLARHRWLARDELVPVRVVSSTDESRL